jgi:hypothetical protein
MVNNYLVYQNNGFDTMTILKITLLILALLEMTIFIIPNTGDITYI